MAVLYVRVLEDPTRNGLVLAPELVESESESGVDVNEAVVVLYSPFDEVSKALSSF